ncbi:MAG: hypothetical protein LC808_19970, partial [Actinobacteria bacterium]|nr:hypothetical protein [Actinomycetota bacterium]
MSNLSVQIAIPHSGGIPENIITNSFSFITPTPPTALHLDAIILRLRNFFNNTYTPGAQAINAFLSNNWLWPNGRVKIYDRADPPPRVPIRDAAFALLTSGSSTALPAECAVVLSFHKSFSSGQPRARSRGRVYIGPLGSNAGAITNGDLRPIVGLRNTLVGAATYLRDANNV